MLRSEIADDIERPRRRASTSSSGRASTRLGARVAAPRSCPTSRERDVYVCGPDGFTAEVVDAAPSAGVPASRIHRESFVL